MSKRPGLGLNYLTPARIKWHKKQRRDYAQTGENVQRLPRYYREKVFTKLERQRFAMESIDLNTALYTEAVEKMKKFHDEPHAYYYERLVYLHENAKHKLNTNNLF